MHSAKAVKNVLRLGRLHMTRPLCNQRGSANCRTPLFVNLGSPVMLLFDLLLYCGKWAAKRHASRQKGELEATQPHGISPSLAPRLDKHAHGVGKQEDFVWTFAPRHHTPKVVHSDVDTHSM
jgi:hypothetical protein